MFTWNWLRKKTPPHEVLNVGDVYFWQEQDGPVERDLKGQLCDSPTFKYVSEAFLMRVRYPGARAEQVALCLVADPTKHQEIVDDVGRTFGRIFNASQSLDALFLTKDQRERVSMVGRPFYRKTLDES